LWQELWIYRDEFGMHKTNCVFCDDQDKVLENSKCFAIYDRFPVNKGHILIIPKRHFSSYFDATKEELVGFDELIFEAQKSLNSIYNPDGYNIGINCGEVAGQTVMHAHIHLIPRYVDDVKDPRGGIRGIIPAKQKY
jgi:diadenosine tetraphosphate (Ap4A) HIT family hydrolase